MNVTRRRLLAQALVAGGAAVAKPAMTWAQEVYPSRRVTMINQFAPGSISDASARLIAQYLQDHFKQPFIVENRVGGGGLVAAVAVARAAPDGYTLLATASSLHSGAALYKELPIDPLKDFTHIARIGSYPSFFVVRADLPIKSIQELVEYAKKNPGKLTYGHGNNLGQIAGETLKRRTGIEIARVAYRSNPAAMTDLIAGHIDMMTPDLNTGLSHVQSGKVRALAFFMKDRSTTMPDVPTLHETVIPGFDLTGWGGLSGPAALPPDAVAKLEAAVANALTDPEIKKRFALAGIEMFGAGQKEFEAYVRQQLTNWSALIKEVGIEPQ